MSYLVIARKWRPQKFEEIVGQETVTRSLQNAIRSDRIAHAFLFSGVRGVGKTTVARILAKALNCENGPAAEPCCTCVSCQEITAANSLDVLEIDAASNRGIDNIRELRESVRYGTARDRFKIFIIDEVHMLTNEAFNALLKTLEEPPPHVKFLMATTEYHKIPVTITSRCQHYEFKTIPFALIFQRLRLIAETDRIEISDYGLRSIASIAQGSMRDAQSALDQVIAFSGSTIEDEDVRAILGIVDWQVVTEITDQILRRDASGLIRTLREVHDSGISPPVLCRRMIEHIRNLMVCKVADWDSALLQLPDSEKDRLVSQAAQLSEPDLIRFYDVLNRTNNELRWHNFPEVHLEISLMKLIQLAGLPALEELLGRLEGGLPARVENPPAVVAGSVKPRPSSPATGQDVSGSAESPGETVTGPQKIEVRKLPLENFREILQVECRGLFEQLQFAEKVSLDAEMLKIVFPTGQGFHASCLSTPENLNRLKSVAAKATGASPSVDIETMKEEADVKAAANPLDDPRVRMFVNLFPGKVIVDTEAEED